MKRLLLITYYFPPCGGAAVQRWVRFIPLLDEAGFEITILTTKNGDYPVTDESLLDKIPSRIKIVRTFTPTFGKVWNSVTGKKSQVPYGELTIKDNTTFLEKVFIWLRLNLVIPDARAGWNPFAKKAAKKLCNQTLFNYVITTGPPHSTHLIGLYLQKRNNLKWIADFRDPWTQIFYLNKKKQNPILVAINKKLERNVVNKANTTLIVSNFIANQLPHGNKIVLFNGYNYKDFHLLSYIPSNKFRIKYIGQLTEGQNIEEFLLFLSLNISAKKLKSVQFQFIGTKNPPDQEYNFPIEKIDFLSHNNAIQEMVNCELLVLLINKYPDNQGMVTTKLFEYLASKTPIICIGPENGEAAAVLKQANAGLITEQINNTIIDYFNEIYDGWLHCNYIRNDHDLEQWSVQQQIKKLTNILT